MSARAKAICETNVPDRWMAEITYLGKRDGDVITFEEIEDLDEIIERGPDWNTIERIVDHFEPSSRKAPTFRKVATVPKYTFTECPVCGSELTKHHEQDADYNEFWDFGCRASIVLDGEYLEVNEQCGNAAPPLEVAVRKLNGDHSRRRLSIGAN